ncbi:MAG: hypothetical protein CMF46_03550 [Legionellales bacterium]|nr:hypothetical protein [Legionellales bacterium]
MKTLFYHSDKMFVILSPAKRMHQNSDSPPTQSMPAMITHAQTLWQTLQTKDVDSIQTLMKVSRTIAELNHQRYASSDIKTLSKTALPPCLLTFDGDVYRFIKPHAFSAKQWEWADTRLGILSGLYGLLRPSNKILPYRLEMKTPLKVGEHKNLYAFWGNAINQQISKIMQENNWTHIINLASKEYSKVVTDNPIEYPIITITFKERSAEKLRTIAVNSKRARGAMARSIIVNNWRKLSDLHQFSDLGYSFSIEHSSDYEQTFIR